MNEAHTTSLALSQRLKALGIPQVSEFYWKKVNRNGMVLWELRNGIESDYPKEYFCSAFLASELGEMLPLNIQIRRCDSTKWACERMDYRLPEGKQLLKEILANTMPEAMGKMLEYLKKEGLI